ncbi:uncharacterized protein LOC128740616 [Sabethes cyaneus]|uniref:uncharacterized protein LOC128740616 n=1 Tax=Sabethes cyaneus TaxID=53552 RepID=UPI00237DFCA8|nr:uncharacterized protein LOC128740616 [Sabethes cyaneus]
MILRSEKRRMEDRDREEFEEFEQLFRTNDSRKSYEKHDVTYENGIRIAYQNVRGLRTKIDELFLSTCECNLDIIILTETGLDDRINSLQLFGSSFNVFRCDRNPCNSDKSSFGGVLIAVAQCHPSAIIETVNGKNLEQISVKATVRGTTILLCGVYIPPNRSQNIDVVEIHMSTVGELLSKCADKDVLLICGDFNQPRLVWDVNSVAASAHLPAAGAALRDGMDFFNLNQINFQTNHLGRTLDLVFCSPDHRSLVEGSITPLLPVDPHHPPLTITVPTARNNSAAFTRVGNDNEKRSLNYRKIDFVALSDYLSSYDWGILHDYSDVSDMTATFCDIIEQWLNLNLPFLKPRNSPAWSTVRLRELKRLKNNSQRKYRRLKTTATRQRFKRHSDDYRRLNSALYKSYVLRVQTDLRKNPKNFWNFVNSKRKCSSVPLNVCLDGTEAISESDSCELFAQFFASVFADRIASDSEAEIAAADVPASLVDLTVFEVTTDMFLAAAKKLKRSYSAGPDGIPAVVFNKCANALADPLCLIFNKSFAQGKFPEIWKQSFMFPVFKSGDRQNVRNYRGITSLSAGSKLFEIIVSGVIHSRTKNYISTSQHGFVPGRSVCTNLLEFTSSCISKMEQKAQIDVIYTDLKAAFDRIDHVRRTLPPSSQGFQFNNVKAVWEGLELAAFVEDRFSRCNARSPGYTFKKDIE